MTGMAARMGGWASSSMWRSRARLTQGAEARKEAKYNFAGKSVTKYNLVTRSNFEDKRVTKSNLVTRGIRERDYSGMKRVMLRILSFGVSEKTARTRMPRWAFFRSPQSSRWAMELSAPSSLMRART